MRRYDTSSLIHFTQRAEILAERSQAFLSLGDLPASRVDAEHAVLEDRFWAEGCVALRVFVDRGSPLVYFM